MNDIIVVVRVANYKLQEAGKHPRETLPGGEHISLLPALLSISYSLYANHLLKKKPLSSRFSSWYIPLRLVNCMKKKIKETPRARPKYLLRRASDFSIFYFFIFHPLASYLLRAYRSCPSHAPPSQLPASRFMLDTHSFGPTTILFAGI